MNKDRLDGRIRTKRELVLRVDEDGALIFSGPFFESKGVSPVKLARGDSLTLSWTVDLPNNAEAVLDLAFQYDPVPELPIRDSWHIDRAEH